jgi:hypothetical protein
MFKRKNLAAVALVVLTSSVGANQSVRITPPQDVRNVICEATYGLKFPTAKDVAAVAWVESKFNPKAKNGISKGIMQVNNGSYNLDVNIWKGTTMLAQLNSTLGNHKASFLAYNVGLGGYKSGRGREEYYRKVMDARSKVDITC